MRRVKLTWEGKGETMKRRMIHAEKIKEAGMNENEPRLSERRNKLTRSDINK